MQVICTKPPRFQILRSLRASYIRWRLDHVESDLVAYEQTLKLWRAEAERMRVELAHLGGLSC